MMIYAVRRARMIPRLEGDWDADAWAIAETAMIAFFRVESSSHRPHTTTRWLYDSEALHGIFRVEDCFVRATHTRFGDPVYKDSCVEAFLQPPGARGYINFECNCGGTLLASYITDPVRLPGGGFREYIPVSEADVGMIGVYHSLPHTVDPEITSPVTWIIQLRIPFALFERYVGPIGDPRGSCWRGNFFKCGDETSHPHWAAWSPVRELNFHLPDCFGKLLFEP